MFRKELSVLFLIVPNTGRKMFFGVAAVFGVGGDEIIGMLALAMQADLPYTKLQETVLPHPTVSELVPWIFNNLKAPEIEK